MADAPDQDGVRIYSGQEHMMMWGALMSESHAHDFVEGIEVDYLQAGLEKEQGLNAVGQGVRLHYLVFEERG